MKDIELRHRSLCHTRQNFDIFNALAEWAVNEAGGGDKVFGTKPKVAEYTPTDLGAESKRAVESNIANMPEIQALLEKILPGYGDMIKQGSKNTLSLLKGEIPQDVQDSIKRTSAFKALSGGYGGSGMAKALTARDFGRTSMDLMHEGGNSAQRWAGISQGANAPFIVTGAQQGEMTMKNNLYKQAVDQFKFNVDAAPDPSAAGIFNLQTALGSMAASFGMGSAMGGMKSGGAGGGSMSGAGVNARENYGSGPAQNTDNLAYNPWYTNSGWG